MPDTVRNLREVKVAVTGAADPVRDFYTRHPYPPPVENLDRARDAWQDENRRRSEYHLFWPGRPYRADIDILVAGCGTWQAAKYALCHPEARVVGIDVSTTSLAETGRLKSKYDLKNLKTEQLPIEDVEQLGQTFDLIICTGVLHHLADPDTGLTALRQVLRADGAMYLMVYATYGRAGIYQLQDYCRRLGIGTSAREIDDLCVVVEALPQQHPLVTLLRASRDALNADALADALLNPRDRSYSVPQLFEMIEGNGLRPVRWYWQAPYLPRCGAIATTPHAERLASLAHAEQFAAMELLRGTMTTHSIILSRDDAPDDAAKVSFDTDDWLRYVPVRLPTTICVEERLPAGATGVLLNRSHSFHDLIIVIDAEEKKLFDLIDSCRSTAQIYEAAGVKLGVTSTRAFFEKLWLYDQVVFDTTESTRISAGG